MVNYQNGKIYKIKDNTNGDEYVGSTCETYLSRRLQKHLARYKYWLKHKKGRKFTSWKILSNNDYKIELIENYPCNNVKELLIREQYWIDKIDCINECRAVRNETRNKKLQYLSNRKRLDYVNSWGGDCRSNNNLWYICPFIFNN